MSFSQFNKINFRLHLNIFLVTSTRHLWLYLSNVFKVAYTKRLFDGIYYLPFSLHLLNIFKVPSIKHLLDSIHGKSKIYPLSYIKTILLVRHLREYMHFQIDYLCFLQYGYLVHVFIMYVNLGKVAVNLCYSSNC